jgi:hypothetical protein
MFPKSRAFAISYIDVSPDDVKYYATEAVVLGRYWNMPVILRRASYELVREKADEESDPKDNAIETNSNNDNNDSDADSGGGENNMNTPKKATMTKYS